MADVDGKWKTIVNSSMGAQEAVLFVKSSGDTFTGTWDSAGSSVNVQNGKVDGDEMSWSANVTTPFPMMLVCKATVDGNSMTGTVKAGSFGTFPMIGTREPT